MISHVVVFDYIEVFYNRTHRQSHPMASVPRPLSRLQRDAEKSYFQRRRSQRQQRVGT